MYYPLWREDGPVVYNYCWSSPAQSFSGDHILLSQIRDSPTWRARSLYLYAPGTGWPGYTPRHWDYDSQGYGGGILTSLHTGFLIPVTWECKRTPRIASNGKADIGYQSHILHNMICLFYCAIRLSVPDRLFPFPFNLHQ
jgi:hypothetical protein